MATNEQHSSLPAPQQSQSLFKFTHNQRILPHNQPSKMPSVSRSCSRSSSSDLQSSPFLRLPTEIRLQIYSLLVLPRRPTDLSPCLEKVAASARDSYDYDTRQRGTDRVLTNDDEPMPRYPVLSIRTIDPSRRSQRVAARSTPSDRVRTSYSVRSDFPARCMSTTYHCVNVPRGIEDQLAILRANKQIHTEAAGLLYGTYTFDFDTHVEAIVPFFSDLTPFARRCIKRIRVVKRALPYEKEFDRAEWSTAWRYLNAQSSNIALESLSLGIVAGRPGENGWDRVPQYSAADFDLLKQLENMEWMQSVLEMRGLEDLDVHAVTEHCPPGTNSMAMASYIRFSASVESGFKSFLRSQLLGASATTDLRGRRSSMAVPVSA